MIKFCSILLVFYCPSSAGWIRSRRLDMISRSQNDIRDDRCKQFQTFTQNVDHFGFINMDKFEQRYIINTDYWKNGRPIFFYAGNEGLISRVFRKILFDVLSLGDIDLFCDNTGFSKLILLII